MEAQQEQEFKSTFIRLSDRILFSLEMALDQDDLPIAELLAQALELSMTRNTGGGEFIERRDYPPKIDAALDRLMDLKKRLQEESED